MIRLIFTMVFVVSFGLVKANREHLVESALVVNLIGEWGSKTLCVSDNLNGSISYSNSSIDLIADCEEFLELQKIIDKNVPSRSKF